ncbi:FAD-binding oxidoreductase [Breoghania sp.]|uniref:NAD(P)/FAD-dependent oxidoreductase n=1 Tax=Breoghania sp. TaxID=2065378 RepID=UPI002AA7C17A|nr:FAD-binding oxidoreductase [Breoghania sp.]
MGRDIIIVGAGITGVATAEWLRRDGWKTTLIDPVEPGSPDQTSYGNAGMLARASFMPVASASLVRKAPAMILDPGSPLYMRWSYLPRLLPWLIPFFRNLARDRWVPITEGLAQVTYDCNDQHMALARGTGAERHIQRGECVTLYRREQEYLSDRLSIETRRKFGIEPRSIDRNELRERDPNLGPAYSFATVLDDYNWLTSPGDYVAALFAHYRAQGGSFVKGKVVDLTPGATPSLTLDGGQSLSADKIALTAGVWSGPLAKKLGVKVRLTAERGYHLAIRNPAFTAPHPYMVTDAKIVVTPMENELRGAGMVEFAGIDDPARDEPVALLRKAFARLYPALDLVETQSWMGRRPTTPDSLPILGEASSAPNVLHAYGGQHVGLTIGPKLGRLVADLAAGRTPNMDLAPYAPDRF